jgi:hypothetical protein
LINWYVAYLRETAERRSVLIENTDFASKLLSESDHSGNYFMVTRPSMLFLIVNQVLLQRNPGRIFQIMRKMNHYFPVSFIHVSLTDILLWLLWIAHLALVAQLG